MKKTSRFVIGALSALLLAITGCSDSKTEQATTQESAEKPRIEGRWSGFESGSTEKITLEFAGNRFAYWDSQTNEIGSGTFVVNDTVKPTHMDLTFERIAAPEYVGKVGLAVFELQGDEMKIAGAEPGSTVRPTDVSGGEGIRTFTFKRE